MKKCEFVLVPSFDGQTKIFPNKNLYKVTIHYKEGEKPLDHEVLGKVRELLSNPSDISNVIEIVNQNNHRIADLIASGLERKELCEFKW